MTTDRSSPLRREPPCASQCSTKPTCPPPCIRTRWQHRSIPYACSAKERTGLEALEQAVEENFPAPDAPAGEILTNARHAEAIGRALESLRAAREAMLLGVTPDAVLTEAEEAMAAIGELTGASIREDITNRIFARFCVGK
ncbi:MAG: hypothetical protein ACLTG4_05235 [Oscillospiraceae bacterium]